jgi:hypothetical protein
MFYINIFINLIYIEGGERSAFGTSFLFLCYLFCNTHF